MMSDNSLADSAKCAAGVQAAQETALQAAQKVAAEAQARAEHLRQQSEVQRTGFQTKLTQLASQVSGPMRAWCTQAAACSAFDQHGRRWLHCTTSSDKLTSI